MMDKFKRFFNNAANSQFYIVLFCVSIIVIFAYFWLFMLFITDGWAALAIPAVVTFKILKDFLNA